MAILKRINLMTILIGTLIAGVIFVVAGMLYAHEDKRISILFFFVGGVVTLFVICKAWSDLVYPPKPAATDVLLPGVGETPKFMYPPHKPTTLDDLPEYVRGPNFPPELRDQMLADANRHNNGGVVTPSPAIPKDAVQIFLGATLVWTEDFPYTVLAQGDEKMMVIDRAGSGILLSAKFFSADGTVVGEVVKNRVILNEANLWGARTERTANRITVFNKKAEMVFDIEYINEHAIRILGAFFLRNGARILITQEQQIFGPAQFEAGFLGNNKGGAIRI